MSKDPATLWYWNDFLTGTMTFTRHLKGCYVDLLGAQFNNGRLSLDEIKTVLGSDFGSAWPTLQKKFEKDESGLYFNVKGEETKNKRKAFTESRRKNLKGSPDMGDHMENEIENRKLKFKENVFVFKEDFPEKILTPFFLYWSEHSEKGKKMRFEKQEVFSIRQRLTTWVKNDKDWKKEKEQKLSKAPTPDIGSSVDESILNQIRKSA